MKEYRRIKGSFVCKIIGITFLIVGIIGVVLAGCFLGEALHFISGAQKVKAVVTEVSHNSTTISFELNGSEISKELHVRSSKMRPDTKVQIYVNRSDVNDVRIDNAIMYLGAIISVSVGGPFVLLGLLFYGVYRLSCKRLDNLINNGIRATGVVVDFQYIYSIKMGTENPVSLIVEVNNPVTGAKSKVSSEPIFVEGDDMIDKTVDVYFNPDNGRKYVVDTDSIR